MPEAKRQAAVSMTLMMFLAAVSAGATSAQSMPDDALVWRRVPLAGLPSSAYIADVASDGRAAAAVVVEPRKRRDRATIWLSQDGHRDWAVVEQSSAPVGDVIDLRHEAGAWLFTGPTPALSSVDGVGWTESTSSASPSDEVFSSVAAPRQIVVGETTYELTPDSWVASESGSETGTPIAELAGLDLVLARETGGIAIGDYRVATTEDGRTWSLVEEPVLAVGSMFGAATELEDGSVIVAGVTPRPDGDMHAALWIGESAGTYEPAGLEESAARYADLSGAYNKERLRIPASFKTMAKARKAAKARADNARTMSAGLAAWPWPPDASDEMAEVVAVLDALASKWDEMAGARNSRQLAKLDKQLSKLSPWNVAAVYEAREVLGLPISNELKRAYNSQR